MIEKKITIVSFWILVGYAYTMGLAKESPAETFKMLKAYWDAL